MRSNIMILFLAGGLCLGCSQGKFTVLDLTKIPSGNYDLSASARTQKYIPLHNQTGDFTGYLTGFASTGKYYFVTDNYSLLKYTTDGEFVASIGNWGIDSGKDGMIYCMDLNAEKNRLYVRTVDEMFVFDLEGKLLERFFLDVPRESHYDPEKQMLVIRKQNKGFHRRFYLSSFYINDQNNFLFKNPDNKGNDVAILICNDKMDSLGIIRNTFSDAEVYDVTPRFGTDRTYYYYQKVQNDTLYQLNQQLKEKPFIQLKNFPSPVVYAARNVFCFKMGWNGVVLYSHKEGKAILPVRGKNKGIYIDNIEWKPVTGIGNHLFLQALASDILENKSRITNPALKRICKALTPESGVVLLDLKLNRLKF